MKKIFILSLFAYLFTACNSDSTSTTTTDSASTTQGAVEVNGNIPDTTNSIKISDKSNTDIDSTHVKDSLKK